MVQMAATGVRDGCEWVVYAGAVHGVPESGGPRMGEEHSIGSLPTGFFDGPSDSGGRQVCHLSPPPLHGRLQLSLPPSFLPE